MNYMNLLKEWKIHLMLLLLILSVVAIDPFKDTTGVVVKNAVPPASLSVEVNDVIININGISVNSTKGYYEIISTILPDDIVRINYKRASGPFVYAEYSAYPFVAEERNNETYLGLVVSDISDSNLKFGLDIVGGTKVLLQPERQLDSAEVENIIAILNQRLNVYGLQDIPVTYQQDLSGNQYFRLEFAGTTEQEVRALLEKEGKFEAKIMNDTVITGTDILDVCITGTQCVVRINPVETSDGFAWNFIFQVDLSQDAAERFANATADLDTGDCDASGCYLNATIDFYMDDEPIEGSQLRISADLKGKDITNPVISGVRTSKQEAEQEMRRMQAILQSGELPVKMNVVRTESISSELGMNFAQNVFLVFFTAIIAVDLIIAFRYRNWKIVIPIVLVSFSEIFITLGIAAAINWTLDFAGIAGIIAAVGTGVSDQIIITDEVLRGEKRDDMASIKKRIGRAFFIIIATFACTVATMIPLLFAGAGLLRGFAITTIIATSTGIFVTRPAFARILELLLK
jgi:preprotein translocase subunit SecD